MFACTSNVPTNSATISDNKETSKWEKFNAAGIPSSNESYDALIFIDSLTGFLGGNKTVSQGEINGRNQFSQETVLYKTTDMGNSWSSISINYEGSIERIIPFEDTLILLIQAVQCDSVFIVKSNDTGATWEVLFSASSSTYIREINFNHSNEGYFVTDDRVSSFLLRIRSSQIDTLFKIEQELNRHKIIGSDLFSLIPEHTNPNSKGVKITNMTDGSAFELMFAASFYVSNLTSYGNTLYFSAHDSTAGKITSISNKKINEYDLGEFKNYFPEEIFIYDQTIIAIVYNPENTSPSGVTHKLLISNNDGKTWELDELPDPVYTSPATLNRSKIFTSYCGSGQFQQRRIY